MHGVIHLEPSEGRQRAKLFELGAVLSEEHTDDGGWNVELKMAERDLRRFLKRENLAADALKPVGSTAQRDEAVSVPKHA